MIKTIYNNYVADVIPFKDMSFDSLYKIVESSIEEHIGKIVLRTGKDQVNCISNIGYAECWTGIGCMSIKVQRLNRGEKVTLEQQ